MDSHRVCFLASAVLLTVLFSGSHPARAQTAISLRPDLIYYTEGDVRLRDSIEFRPSSGQFRHFEKGQQIVTGAGKAKVFLNFAATLRVGEHSEVSMTQAESLDVRVRLLHGSAIIEVRKKDGMESVSILAGDARVRFQKKGLYRFDYPSGSPPTLKVFRGVAVVSGLGPDTEVGAKRSMTFNPQSAELLAFDRSQKDDLDRWQKERAALIQQDELARAAGVGPSTESDALALIWRRLPGGNTGASSSTYPGSSGGSGGSVPRASGSAGGTSSRGTTSTSRGTASTSSSSPGRGR